MKYWYKYYCSGDIEMKNGKQSNKERLKCGSWSAGHVKLETSMGSEVTSTKGSVGKECVIRKGSWEWDL
jgi:hypothetical protein